MRERLILVVVLAAILAVAILAVRAWSASQTAMTQRIGPAWDALGERPDGRPTLVAFSTPSCTACHKAQAPAIALVREQLGLDHLRVIRIDAARQPDVARAFGVLTVPSTVVIGTDGDQIVAINRGFAPSGRLLEQLAQA